MKNTQKEKITKTIRLEQDIIDEIEKLAKESERDFSKQVKFMLKKYIEIQKK